MYYLHVTTQLRAAANPRPYANTHGPFASETEASGFFRKLALWYPQQMQQARYKVVYQSNQQRPA